MGTVVFTVLCLNFCRLTMGLSSGEESTKLQIQTEYKPDNCSVAAEDGDTVAIHYTGYLENGSIFDSSVENQRDPIVFVLGQGFVIKGWDLGLKGMCIGEKRKLIIPHQLAYGERGSPPVIPGNATLTFDTEMINIRKKAMTNDKATADDTTTEAGNSGRSLASFLHAFICVCSSLIITCVLRV